MNLNIPHLFVANTETNHNRTQPETQLGTAVRTSSEQSCKTNKPCQTTTGGFKNAVK